MFNTHLVSIFFQVRKHAKEYRAQIDELEVARREVEREFEEVHTKRDELQIWQREAEETLQSRIESFTTGKEELQMQIQELVCSSAFSFSTSVRRFFQESVLISSIQRS